MYLEFSFSLNLSFSQHLWVQSIIWPIVILISFSDQICIVNLNKNLNLNLKLKLLYCYFKQAWGTFLSETKVSSLGARFILSLNIYLKLCRKYISYTHLRSHVWTTKCFMYCVANINDYAPSKPYENVPEWILMCVLCKIYQNLQYSKPIHSHLSWHPQRKTKTKC